MANATSGPRDVTNTFLLTTAAAARTTTTLNAYTSTPSATLEPSLLAAYICFGIGGLLVIIAVIFVVILSLRHKLCKQCCCCRCAEEEEEEDLILQLKYFKAPPQKPPPKPAVQGNPPDCVPVSVAGTKAKYDVAHPSWTVEKTGTGKRGSKDIHLKTTHVPLRSDRVYMHTQHRTHAGRPVHRLQGPAGPVLIGYGRPGEGLKYYRVKAPSDGKNKHLKNWIIKQRDFSSDVGQSRITDPSNSVNYNPGGPRVTTPSSSWDSGREWRLLPSGASLTPSERALYLRWSPTVKRRYLTDTSQVTGAASRASGTHVGQARAMGGQSQINKLSRETWASSYTQHLTLPQIQGSATIYRAPLGPKIMVNGTAVSASQT